MYLEEELLQLSALQHLVFCPRQCALIHIEQLWGENKFTAEGRIMHEDVHEESIENRKDVRIERGIPLRSLELGLSGKADVVEFRKAPGVKGWIIFPLEYKRGKPKFDHSDTVQLCAQAICLEEMLKTNVPLGALYYGKTRHRLDVEFNDALRNETKGWARNLHEFILCGKTPDPVYSSKCDACSLIELCLPKSIGRHESVSLYLKKAMQES